MSGTGDGRGRSDREEGRKLLARSARGDVIVARGWGERFAVEGREREETCAGDQTGAGWRFGQTRVERSKDESRRSGGLIYEHRPGADECRISEKGLGS